MYPPVDSHDWLEKNVHLKMYVLFKEMVMCPVTVSHLSFYWRITSFCCVFFLRGFPRVFLVWFTIHLEKACAISWNYREAAGSWSCRELKCGGLLREQWVSEGVLCFFRWSFWIIEVWLCNYVFVLHRNKWIIVSGFWVFDMSKAIGYTFEDMFPILSHHLAIFQTNKQTKVCKYV